MAVFASAADPRGLVARVTEAVKRGSACGWDLTAGHLRHASSRESRESRVAFFTMTVTDGAVKFTLARPKDTRAFDASAYAYHHGRLTELLLARFSDLVTRVQSTPFPGPLDAKTDAETDVEV